MKKEAINMKNHARVMVYANSLATLVECGPTPSNVRKWRHKANMILRALDNAEEWEEGEGHPRANKMNPSRL